MAKLEEKMMYICSECTYPHACPVGKCKACGKSFNNVPHDCSSCSIAENGCRGEDKDCSSENSYADWRE